MKTVLVYVELLEEGSPAVRGTQAIPVGDNSYKLLADDTYGPEDEIWEFLLGSLVKCISYHDDDDR